MPSSQEQLAGYLSEEAIQVYRVVYRRQFGRVISKQEVYDQAIQVIGYLKNLSRPIGDEVVHSKAVISDQPTAKEEPSKPSVYSKVLWDHQAIRQGGSGNG